MRKYSSSNRNRRSLKWPDQKTREWWDRELEQIARVLGLKDISLPQALKVIADHDIDLIKALLKAIRRSQRESGDHKPDDYP